MSQSARERSRRRTALAVAMLVLGCSTLAAETEYDLSVYVWVPTTEGELGFDIPSSGDKIQVDPSELLQDLQMAGMLGFGAHKDRWSFLLDAIYLDLGDTNQSSVPLRVGSGLDLQVGTEFELKGWIAGIAGDYHVIQSERADFGVVFGARYLSFDTDLTLQIDGPLPPQLPTEHHSQKSELLDGIVGVRGHYGRKWYWSYYLDVGAGDSDLTWQAMTGFGYRWNWGDFFAVYRYLKYDEGEPGLLTDLSLGGPAVGVKFRF